MHAVLRGRDRPGAARAADVGLVRPADAVGIRRAAPGGGPDRLEVRAPAAGDVRRDAARRRGVALVVVRVAVEARRHVVELQQPLERVRALEVGVGPALARVGVERVVPEGEAQRARVGREVVREPLVLRGVGPPVVVEVVLERGRRAGVRVVPRGGQHVEARHPGVERVPAARVVHRGRAVQAAVRIGRPAPARRGGRRVLGPVREGHRVVVVVVAERREQRQRCARDLPVVGAEDRARVVTGLVEVAVALLAARPRRRCRRS